MAGKHLAFLDNNSCPVAMSNDGRLEVGFRGGAYDQYLSSEDTHGEAGNNVVFAGGHVEWIKRTDYIYRYELSEDEGRIDVAVSLDARGGLTGEFSGHDWFLFGAINKEIFVWDAGTLGRGDHEDSVFVALVAQEGGKVSAKLSQFLRVVRLGGRSLSGDDVVGGDGKAVSLRSVGDGVGVVTEEQDGVVGFFCEV